MNTPQTINEIGNKQIQPTMRKLAKVTSSVAIVFVMWFLVVDWSWFIEDCPNCYYQREVYQYRFFTIPIYIRTRVHETFLQKVAEDLGTPCKHPTLNRWHKHRWWGFYYCAYPCINGIYNISDGSSMYDENARAKVKEIVKANPAIREEFAEKVLKLWDKKYYYDFVAQIDPEHYGPKVETTTKPMENDED